MQRNFEHGGNLYAAGRKKGVNILQFLDFSANINPLGLAPSVRQAVLSNLEGLIHYPDCTGYELKQEISKVYGVSSNQIILGNGAVELLYVLSHMLRPREVLVAAPTFNEYERSARAGKSEVRYHYLFPESNFTMEQEKFISQLPDNGLAYVCNPNNPTGTLLRWRQIEEIISAGHNKGVYIVVDESFLDFLPNDSDYTCRHLLAKYDNLIVLNSLTKFYAIPGLRLGFGLTNSRLTTYLEKGKDQWNVNVLAHYAGVAALQDSSYQQRSREMVSKEKDQLFQAVKNITGFRPYFPSVNFMLVNISAIGMSATNLRERLFAENILVRDCSNYPGLTSDYIRVAVKMPEENTKLVAALQKIVGEKID